jgi:ribA/ribD-fused uncharacterized protein
MIYKFADKYYFLSNFYEKPIIIKGKEYKSVEHAYQAFKTKNISEHEWVRNAPTASKAKSFGKKIKVREDWDELKYKVMLKLVRLKFKDEELKKMILETGDEELVEGNYWHDNVWGKCNCKRCEDIEGKNWLGKILMKVREEIKDEIELFK